jgi:hypothetical protein
MRGRPHRLSSHFVFRLSIFDPRSSTARRDRGQQNPRHVRAVAVLLPAVRLSPAAVRRGLLAERRVLLAAHHVLARLCAAEIPDPLVVRPDARRANSAPAAAQAACQDRLAAPDRPS